MSAVLPPTHWNPTDYFMPLKTASLISEKTWRCSHWAVLGNCNKFSLLPLGDALHPQARNGSVIIQSQELGNRYQLPWFIIKRMNLCLNVASLHINKSGLAITNSMQGKRDDVLPLPSVPCGIWGCHCGNNEVTCPCPCVTWTMCACVNSEVSYCFASRSCYFLRSIVVMMK